jgi:hypothetical protein
MGMLLGPLSFPYAEFGVVTTATTIHDVRAWLARTHDTDTASHHMLRFGSDDYRDGYCAAERWVDQHNYTPDSGPSLAFDPTVPQVLDCSRTLVSYGYGRCRRKRLVVLAQCLAKGESDDVLKDVLKGEAEDALKGGLTGWHSTLRGYLKTNVCTSTPVIWFPTHGP